MTNREIENEKSKCLAEGWWHRGWWLGCIV